MNPVFWKVDTIQTIIAREDNDEMLAFYDCVALYARSYKKTFLVSTNKILLVLRREFS